VIRLYLVTDRRLVPDLPAAVHEALSAIPPGSAAVQLREKDLAARELLELLRRLVPICRAAGAPLLVNDRADLARLSGADGVHLPSRGLPVAQARALLPPGALLGVSCHSEAEIASGHREGADFAVFGPVWDSPGKPARGLAALASATRAAPLPVFAIGGVTAERAPRIIEAGARGVACIRAVFGAADPAAAARELYMALAGC
jgi:thiamine-phosphate pyrophosphorylase